MCLAILPTSSTNTQRHLRATWSPDLLKISFLSCYLSFLDLTYHHLSTTQVYLSSIQGLLAIRKIVDKSQSILPLGGAPGIQAVLAPSCSGSLHRPEPNCMILRQFVSQDALQMQWCLDLPH